MKNSLFLFLCFLFVSGCSSTGNNEIALFNGITFQLNPGERVIELDSTVKADFTNVVPQNEVSTPLYRCIKSKNHTIYLALPLNLSVNKLLGYRQATINKFLDVQSDSTTFFYLHHNRNNKHITEFLHSADQNLIYALSISTSTADTTFTLESWKQRIRS